MKKRNYLYLISFMLPVILLLLIYALWGQYPFSDKTLLMWDMNDQYAPFFAQLSRILHGDASVLYSLSRALGGNMFSVAAYYLMSPFNIVFYFFDAENIYAGVLLVTLLKTGSCGLSMYWFLNRKRQSIFSLIFALAYALNAYMTGYLFNIFWIDALILLPCVCEGIELLTEDGKYILYIVSLALSIITNFYTGYMLCIFSVIYFLCYFLFISDKKYRFKVILMYALSSITGGLLSMCVLLPALDIMQGGKSGISFGVLKNFKNMFGYGELFDAAFCMTISDEQITSGKPLIYCTVFALIVAIFLLIRGTGVKNAAKRLGYALIMFALIVSFHHYNLNCVWHVFNRPTGSPYRYSFIYIFMVLYMGYMGYVRLSDADYGKKGQLENDKFIKNDTLVINGMRVKYDKCVIIGIGLCLSVGLLLRAGTFIESGKSYVTAVNILLIIAYVSVLLAIKSEKRKFFIILGLTGIELFINAESLYMSSEQYATVSVSEYREYMDNMQPLLETVNVNGVKGQSKSALKAEDAQIFRIALDRKIRQSDNEPFMLGIYGLDSYTSAEKQNTMQIAGNFGYSNNILWGIHYNDGATKAGDSFLGVRYLITDGGPYSGKGYDLVEKVNDLALYENKNALPFAFMADDMLLDIENSGDTFEYMNELYRSLSPERKEDIFVKLKGKDLVDKADNGNEPTEYFEYEYVTDEEMTIYTRYDRAGISKAELILGNEVIDLSSQHSDVKNMGKLPAGSVFRLRFYPAQDAVVSYDKIYVYGERENALKAYADDVKADNVRVIMNSEDDMKIFCDNKSDKPRYLICTVPYDKGFRVKTDGEKAQVMDAQNFVAIPVSQGKHEIELKFVPRGLYLGIFMTLASALCLALTFYGRKFSVRLNLFRKNDIL